MKTKKTIGILGGGQLGMFLCNSAKKQEVKVSIFLRLITVVPKVLLISFT